MVLIETNPQNYRILDNGDFEHLSDKLDRLVENRRQEGFDLDTPYNEEQTRAVDFYVNGQYSHSFVLCHGVAGIISTQS